MAATDFEVVRAVLSEDPISIDDAITAVESSAAGAVVTFSGTVRNHDGGRAVDRLGYSAHPTASQRMAEVVAELAAEHTALDSQPVRIWAAHRVGMLQIGDPALVCAVSAAHRSQAFAVCSELVDRIKSQVPIWKEQFFSDGAVEWVGSGEES
jgi:molybdopterin synthase catalytic subunit